MTKELKYKMAKEAVPQELQDRIAEDVKDILNVIEKKYENTYKKAKA